MSEAIRRFVRSRAEQRCEYCGIRDDEDLVLAFHVEHIRARKHGGGDESANLAFACHHCNLHKGSNLSGIDPMSDAIEGLFHPRHDVWAEHFRNERGVIRGLTPTGRATIQVLAMNRADRVELRRELLEQPE